MPKLSERRKNMILINQSKNAPFFCPTLLAKPNCKDLLPRKQVARKCQSRENKSNFNTQKDLFLTVGKHIGREKTAHFAGNVQLFSFLKSLFVSFSRSFSIIKRLRMKKSIDRFFQNHHVFFSAEPRQKQKQLQAAVNQQDNNPLHFCLIFVLRSTC